MTAPDARRPADERALVVLAGPDAAALGSLAAELEGRGARVALFVGDLADPAERTALRALVDELFAGRW